MTYGKLSSPIPSQSSKSYADYLRVAKERGRSRRAAYESMRESRENEFRLYTSGANCDKENRKVSTDNIAVPSNNGCHWAMQTIEIKSQDGGVISLRPPGRQGSETCSESSSSSPLCLPKEKPKSSAVMSKATPRSLADALVAKILELDVENQLSLLQALQEADLGSKPIKQTRYPTGSKLTLVLRSNWGDPSQIGLHAVAIHSDTSEPVSVKSVSPPEAIGIFTGEDDSWSCEYDEALPVKIEVEFDACIVKKLDVFNFRSQRSLLGRGARHVDVFIDGIPVASFEVPKMPLLLTQSDDASIEVKFGCN